MQKLLSCSSVLLSARPSCCVQLEFVRCLNKPRWLPIAKSKMFVVRQKKRLPPDECTEHRYLKNKYTLMMRSLMHHEKLKFDMQTEKEESVETHLIHEAEIDRIIEENEKINAHVSFEREKYLEEKWIKTREDIESRRTQLELEEEERLRLTEIEIAEQVERIKNSIKLEDLDAYIEKVFSLEVDYNFAIDKNGNRYYGRDNNTVPKAPPAPGAEDVVKIVTSTLQQLRST